jgi:hypothetical protein
MGPQSAGHFNASNNRLTEYAGGSTVAGTPHGGAEISSATQILQHYAQAALSTNLRWHSGCGVHVAAGMELHEHIGGAEIS